MCNGSDTYVNGTEEKSSRHLCGNLIKYLSPSVEGVCLPLAIIFRQARYLVPFYIQEEYQELYIQLLNYAAAMSTFSFWIALLDSFHLVLLSYARKVDSISANNKQSNKWKRIMKIFGSFENFEKDEAYAIPGGRRSAARVLAEIVGIYCNIGKVMGAFMLLLFFLGIDLYSSLVALGLTVLLAGIVFALHINEALKNVLSLVISNSIHVGEIISVGRTGFTPADNPVSHVTGFVEGITWTHIILRDFKRKETFISHDQFFKLTCHNWSRRPTKDVHYIIPMVPGLSGGADRPAKLAKFACQWVKAHSMIDQDLYQKIVIKLTKEKGLCLEVIFYPLRGEKARQIRSEFIVMIMDAAKRYNICLMPAEVRPQQAWSDEHDYASYEEDMLDDLLPSEALTKRAGFKPKKND